MFEKQLFQNIVTENSILKRNDIKMRTALHGCTWLDPYAHANKKEDAPFLSTKELFLSKS